MISRVYHPLGSYDEAVADVHSLYRALAYQLTQICGTKYNFQELEGKAGSGNVDSIIEKLSKSENGKLIKRSLQVI